MKRIYACLAVLLIIPITGMAAAHESDLPHHHSKAEDESPLSDGSASVDQDMMRREVEYLDQALPQDPPVRKFFKNLLSHSGERE